MDSLRVRRRGCILWLAIAVFLAVIASPALAEKRYASPGGPGDCSSPANSCDLKTAIEGAVSGDEVIVAGNDGDYVSSPISSSAKIYVHADEPKNTYKPRVTFYSGGSGPDLSLTGGATLEDLDLESGTGLLLELGGTGGVLDRVVVQNFGGTDPGTAVKVDPGASYTLRDSTALVDALHGSALEVDGHADLRNFTAHAAAGSATAGLLEKTVDDDHPASVTAKSVIARGTGPDIDQVVPSGVTADNTLAIDYSNFSTAVQDPGATFDAGSHNQMAVPDLGVNQETVPGDPTIDAGILDSLSGTTDLYDRPRVLGNGPDIGANEVVPPPILATDQASEVSPKGATFNGTVVNPEGVGTYWYFEWGTTTSYGNTSQAGVTADDVSPHAVNAVAFHLEPGRTYHYRLVGTNFDTAYGPDRTFTTPPAVGTPLGLVSSASDLETSGSSPLVLTYDGGTDYAAQSNGVITSWSTYVGDAPGTAAQFAVYDIVTKRVVRSGTMETTLTPDSVNSFTLSPGIPISAGQSIALRIPAVTPFYAHYDTGLVGDGVFEYDEPVPGGALTWHDGLLYERPNVAATFEPDADHDGYGDITQDECPGDPTKHTGCPEPSAPQPPAPHPLPSTIRLRIVGRPAVHGQTVTLRLSCPATNCRGVARLIATEQLRKGRVVRVAARLQRRHTVVGSRRFAIPAGQTRAVKVALGRRGQQLLARFSRLPVVPTVALSSSGSGTPAFTAGRVVLRRH